MTSEDIDYLSLWINPAYLKASSWDKIRKRFEHEGSMQLYDFLLPEIAQRVIRAAVKEDKDDGLGCGAVPCYDAGTDNQWKLIGNLDTLDILMIIIVILSRVVCYLKSVTTICT